MRLRYFTFILALLVGFAWLMIMSSANAAPSKYVRWSKAHLPLKVYIENATNLPGYKASYSSNVALAFKQWQTDTKGLVSFVQVKDKNTADIQVSWTDKMSKEDASLASKGHSYVWAITKLGNPTKILLVTKHPLNNKQSLTDNTIYMISLHEIGHALGIWWHTKDPNDIMYPDFIIPSIASNGSRLVTNQNKGTLSKRDIQNLSSLYNNNNVVNLDKLAKGANLTMPSVNNSIIGNIETTGIAAASVGTKSTKLNVDLGKALGYLKENPGSFEAYNNIGLVYLESGDYDLAIASFSKALSLNPDYPKAHFNLGLTYERTKKRDLAVAEFEKYLLLDPDANNAQDVKKVLARLKAS